MPQYVKQNTEWTSLWQIVISGTRIIITILFLLVNPNTIVVVKIRTYYIQMKWTLIIQNNIMVLFCLTSLFYRPRWG